MSKCEQECIREDLEHMRNMKDEVVREFRMMGRASTEFLDGIGIVKDDEFTVRDDLVISRQDCTLITHEDTVARYRVCHSTAPS
jgi:hypothetical protein